MPLTTKLAASTVDGTIFLHPAVGMTKPGDVDYFTRGLNSLETEAVLSILMFYAGVSFKVPPHKAK